MEDRGWLGNWKKRLKWLRGLLEWDSAGVLMVVWLVDPEMSRRAVGGA